MPIYVQLETGALTDAKLLGVGPMGFTLWTKGLLYAKEHLTDGDIPREALPLLGLGIPDPEAVAVTLVSHGLWCVTKTGWTIGAEKWARHQTTKLEVEAKRNANAERQKRYRQAKEIARETKTTCDNQVQIAPISNTEVTEPSRVTNASESTPRNTTPKPEPKPKPEPEPIIYSEDKSSDHPASQDDPASTVLECAENPPEVLAEPVRDPSEPFRSIALCLKAISDRMGSPPPIAEEVRPHLRKTDPLRLLVEKLGPEVSAECYITASRKWRGVATWQSVWQHHAALIKETRAPVGGTVDVMERASAALEMLGHGE